ncbi:restriction endonuclease subunit S [Fusobacterium polymorphum]|uniref:restriction endonuclease subunit S n=1 Tax=Fusobacterium nucleatum subsp. polymorphum TaxID=76857 RepID=UPI001C6F48E4|nr:restriction endonuclease subunit S [Fusobacterium polymorphum]QYR60496.1 restriction endonuclease subunit S [Fusobacterium polymorphum]
MKIFNKSAWKKVKLVDICEIITGNTPLKKEKEYWDKDEVPFITPPELKYEGINYITPNIYVSKIGAKQGRIIPKNSICVCCIGSLGKLGILKEDAITNQQINSLILKNKNVDLLYLYFYLKTIKNNLESIASSTTVKIINKSSFEKIEIILPNLEIQKKISKKLELLENNIDFRKNQLNYLKELNKSLFTRMFGDIKTNDKNWEIKKFHEIISILTDYHANGSYKILKDNVELLDFKEYALMIRTTDLENNNFIQGVKYINEKAYNFLKKTKIFGGELIINKIGSAGNVYLMPYLNIPVSLGMNQFMIRLKKDYSNIFYYKLLTTEYYTNVIKSNVQGAVTKTITKEAIKNIDIIIPPIELQNKFAERVEKIEKLKFTIWKIILKVYKILKKKGVEKD